MTVVSLPTWFRCKKNKERKKKQTVTAKNLSSSINLPMANLTKFCNTLSRFKGRP